MMTEGPYKKNPTTLPTPSIRAAHAFPAAWSDGGSVSTRSARSTACTAEIHYLEIRGINMCYELTSVDGEVNEINRQDSEPYSKIVVLDVD